MLGVWVVRLWDASHLVTGRCGCVLGHMSLRTLSVFGSSLVRQIMHPYYFLLRSTAASNVCLTMMAFSSAGLVWFVAVWMGSGFGLSQSGLVLKLWQEDKRYWLRWQCGWLMGQARVCFKTLGTAVFTGGHIRSTTLCLMLNIYRFVSRWGCYNADHLISPPQCYGYCYHVQAAITSYRWNHPNYSVDKLFFCGHWMEPGNRWALPEHRLLQYLREIPTQPRNDFTGFISKHQDSSTITM